MQRKCRELDTKCDEYIHNSALIIVGRSTGSGTGMDIIALAAAMIRPRFLAGAKFSRTFLRSVDLSTEYTQEWGGGRTWLAPHNGFWRVS
jgi:hypothetical protein